MIIRRPHLGWLSDRWRQVYRNDHVLLALLAVVIGMVVAYAAIGFRILIEIAQFAAFQSFSNNVIATAAELPWWHLLLAPTLGGLIVGALVRAGMPGTRTHGPADVIEAAAVKDGRMSIKTGLLNAVANATALGTGSSTGREGPVVHLGGALAGGVAGWLGLTPNLSRTVLGCGVAAAVAASFNAPLAGVFFALEVVLGHYALPAFAPIVISGVIATIISRIHLGDFPAFTIPDYPIGSFFQLPAFMILGLVSALVAATFMTSVPKVERVFERVGVIEWLRPPIAGFCVGAIALYFPQVLSVGYEATDAALKAELPLTLLLALIAAKMVAAVISFGGRYCAGLFSPSLYLGAMTGGAFGIFAAMAFPELAANSGLYAIAGMGAVTASILGAPISTTLIVFELTGDYQLAIVVMVTVAMASIATHQMLGRSFFHMQLERRGVHLRGGQVEHMMRQTTVGDLMSREFQLISEIDTIDHIRERLYDSRQGELMVVDEEGRLAGVIGFAEYKEVAFDSGLDPLIVAKDVARANPPVLEANDSLERALAIMDVSGEDHVPVVDGLMTMKVVGVVNHKEVLLAYNKVLIAARAEERGH